MTYRELAATSIRWRPWQGDGIEHLSVGPAADGILACGVVVGERGGTRYGIHYRIVCDDRWAVRAFEIESTDGRALALAGDGKGHWRNRAGKELPEFDGCVDIDLAGTPVTNTLPIRRERWQVGETRHFSMLYVPFDTLEPLVDNQIYTCLAVARRFRYQAADRRFEAELPLDDDGFVQDYPPLFRRVETANTPS